MTSYRLIAHSKLPKAVEFESWVFDEVLPTIRKTGSYGAQNISPMLQYLIQMEQKQNALESRQNELEHQLDFNKNELIQATFEFGRIGILQRKEISKAVRLRTIEICRYANVYESVGKRVVNSIYKALQKHFDVPSYVDFHSISTRTQWCSSRITRLIRSSLLQSARQCRRLIFPFWAH